MMRKRNLTYMSISKYLQFYFILKKYIRTKNVKEKKIDEKFEYL